MLFYGYFISLLINEKFLWAERAAAFYLSRLFIELVSQFFLFILSSSFNAT